MVTREAIGAHFSLIMTGDACAHPEDDGWTHLRNHTVLDVAMALLAFELAHRDMPLMREVHERRHLVDSMPRDLLTILYIGPYLLGLFAGTDFPAMASGADAKPRQTREVGLLHVLMTEVALQATTGVGPMIELNRLDNRRARRARAQREHTHEHHGNVPKPR